MAQTPPPLRMDPVAAAHRSRSGKREAPPPDERRSRLQQADLNVMLDPGWLPDADVLDDLTFHQIERIRDEQQRHLNQCQLAAASLREFERRFEQEDADHEAALQSAYAEGKDATKVKDKRTSEQERARLLAVGRENSRAAHRAAIAWADKTIEEVRVLAVDWEEKLSNAQAETRSQIEELNKQIDELKRANHLDGFLGTWLKRTRSTVAGQLVVWSRLPTPAPEQATHRGLQPMSEAILRREYAARGMPYPKDQEGA